MSSMPPDCAPDHPDCEHSPQILRGGDHSAELRGAGKRSLTLALVLVVAYMFVEVVGGLLSGSLALIADAGHMLTDAASIGLALAAMHFATRAASTRRTFGYHRLEILAALVNGLTLVGISIWVIVEAYQRFLDPPTVQGGMVLTVGSVGLLVNLAAAWILHGSAKHSVNVEGALQHVIADLLGSVAVVVSGVLIWAFGWYLADPILSAFIGVLILAGTWRLLPGSSTSCSRARPITSMSRPCATECRMWMAWPVCTTFTAGRSLPVTTRSPPTSRSTPAVPRRSVTMPSWTGCATSRTTSSS